MSTLNYAPDNRPIEQLTRAELLQRWQGKKAELDRLTIEEMELRLIVLRLAFPQKFADNLAEGASTIDLDHGWKMTGEFKLNYKVTDQKLVPKKLKELKSTISMKAQLAAESFFRAKYEISVTEYRKIFENDDVEYGPIRKILEDIVEIKPASPTLKLIPPKA